MKFFVMFLTTILINGCGYDNTTLEKSNPNSEQKTEEGPGDPDDQASPLNFALIYANILKPKCVRCHSDEGGNPHGVNLETYTNVLAVVDEIQLQVSSGKMPKRGSLLESEKELLFKWIEIGAPE